MKIEDILKLESVEDVHKQLKRRHKPQPDFETINKQWEIKGHDVMSKVKRPDKKIKVTEGDREIDRTEAVSRRALTLQKLIVNMASAFAFGNKPIFNISAENISEQHNQVLRAVNKMQQANKHVSHNKKMAKLCMKNTECAEYWYIVDDKDGNEKYGFETDKKVRVTIFSNENGDTLYPLFDEHNDLVAFSREYLLLDDDGDEVTCFETYTADKVIKWTKTDKEWVVEEKPNTLGKIPIVYISQPQHEWADVQNLIDALEKILSNFGDTNEYHGSPKIFINGNVRGFSKKGETGAIIQGDEGTKAEYLSWNHAPESVKIEIETLLRLIHTLSQTPDISLESIKGLTNVSGVALKMFFLNAHLKVEDKKEIYIDMLQRRVNILKAYTAILNPSLAKVAKAIEIECEIDPYMPSDLINDINMLTNATNGKQILSQKTAITMSGLVSDADAELKQIQLEQSESNVADLFNPTM